MTVRAMGFGYKMAWLAAQGCSPAEVGAALSLGPLGAAGWEEAVEAAHSGGWLITPAVDGWVLAASASLGSLVRGDISDLVSRVAGLSSVLGAVDYYCTHRVVELHAWLRATGGDIVRGYGFVGESDEVLLDLGEVTPEEQQVREWDERERARDLHDIGDSIFDQLEASMWRPSEESVLSLASLWSIDPRDLEAAEVDGLPLMRRP